jgi:hypothetical protein
MGVILPLVDKENFRAATALQAIRDRLQLAAITGQINVSQVVTANGTIVSIGGAAFAPFAPTGVQYLLTAENVLLITVGSKVEALADGMKAAEALGVYAEVEAGWPSSGERQDKFIYGLLTPDAEQPLATVLIGGAIRRQALYFDVLIRPE